MSVLSLDRVSCRFYDGRRAVAALDDVSLAVRAGELVALMGPSGSGKSTLVHAAAGLVRPASGSVCLLGTAAPPGRAATRWWADRRRAQIGFVHQRLNLVPGLSARDNVALPLELDGWTTPDARRAAADALTRSGAQDLADLHGSHLSIGQQQRVAVARAIVGGRPLVLADEPTAALDTAAAEEIVELLANLAHEGQAVVLVTHDGRLASWADRVVLLRDGRIVDEVGAGLATVAADDPGVATPDRQLS
ncbi:MAG: ABC transporter ATP-binding protein [Actinobacteria bacterium]|nr:ABC transporter ATP-binding protein [Actinomycetota bacterium]